MVMGAMAEAGSRTGRAGLQTALTTRLSSLAPQDRQSAGLRDVERPERPLAKLRSADC